MKEKALVFSENEFGKIDGKVANGLVRYSERYNIVGVIDSTKAGLDAGECLDGIKNGIPIFRNIDSAIENLNYTPKCFIYGIAPLSPFLNREQRQIIITAMGKGMDIVNGLPEFFTDDKEFMQKAGECNVKIFDFRKPPKRKDLHLFCGQIFKNKTPVIVVTGTDCAVGKMTTARILVDALKKENINAVFIATGQAGLIQGAKYGIALDVLTSGFTTGEVEKAIIDAVNAEHPDIIIVEGQGGLSHPAFNSSIAIIKGANPDAIIIQHPPKRKNHCDFPTIPMPSLEYEIELNELLSKSKVIAITINHEDMTDVQVKDTVDEYESRYELPTTDVLKFGCDKLVETLFKVFPELQKGKSIKC